MATAQTLAETLVAPGRALAGVAARRSIVPPLVAATVASLAFTLVLVPRVDFAATVQERLDKDPQLAQQMSPHEREVAVERAEKIGGAGAYAAGALTPALRAVAVALCLWMAFRVAGSRPAFGGTLAVASWALLPLALELLLSLPALWRRHGITAQQATALLPSSPAALLPASAPAPLLGVAGALDLFALWSVALVAIGMAQVAAVSRARAWAVVLVLWCSYVLLQHVTLPGFGVGR